MVRDQDVELEPPIAPSEALGALPLMAAISLEELETIASRETAQIMLEILLAHPEMEIRPEQFEALDAIHKAREQGATKALIQMATGLGKTNVVAADIKRFLERNPGNRVLFLCHQNDILSQARDRFGSLLGDEYTLGTLTGEEEDLHEVDCLFASFQAMRNWREAFYEDEFDYIAVDESHHGKAPTYEPTLQYFKPSFLLGVTATPDRSDLKNIREIFGPEVYQLPLEEAIARGLLASVDYRVISDDVAIRELLRQVRRMHGHTLTVNQLNRTIFLPMRDEAMANMIKERADELDRPPKRIIFCNSIEHTEEFATYFEHAAPLHSKLPKWEQDRYIEQFRNGEIDTLLAVDMFNEGIDIPDANQIVFLRSTQSKTVFLQQLGRGLRKIPGKDSVQVLDFVANCDRLSMLDEMWRTVTSYISETQPIQPEKILRIDIGGINFSEEIRDILEILDDLRVTAEQARSWTKEDSIKLYRELDAERLKDAADSGRLRRKRISTFDISQNAFHNGGPSLRTVLAPFEGNMDRLHIEAGGHPLKLLTKDELIDFMVQKIDELGRTPKSTEFMNLSNAPALNQVRRYFDSYEEFRKAANRKWLEQRRQRTSNN